MNNRAVVEVDAEVHKELRKLAATYDAHIYLVASLLLEDCLSNPERVAAVLGVLSAK